MCVYLCLIHTYFSLRGNHAFERSEEKNYNKKYYADNKEKIADKKRADYREDVEKSRADSAA